MQCITQICIDDILAGTVLHDYDTNHTKMVNSTEALHML